MAESSHNDAQIAGVERVTLVIGKMPLAAGDEYAV